MSFGDGGISLLVSGLFSVNQQDHASKNAPESLPPTSQPSWPGWGRRCLLSAALGVFLLGGLHLLPCVGIRCGPCSLRDSWAAETGPQAPPAGRGPRGSCAHGVSFAHPSVVLRGLGSSLCCLQRGSATSLSPSPPAPPLPLPLCFCLSPLQYVDHLSQLGGGPGTPVWPEVLTAARPRCSWPVEQPGRSPGDPAAACWSAAPGRDPVT